MNVIVAVFLLLALYPGTASAQASVTKVSGGSIKTNLGMSIVLNEGSTLEREWITIHQALPADLVGTTGVRTVFVPSRVRGEYNYQADLTIEAKEPLAAITVHYLLFDVWGRHVRTLALTKVTDVEPGRKSFSGTWRAWSENDVAIYYASVAYIARVRTKAGRVTAAAAAPVLAEARKFASKFADEDLEPSVRPEPR